MLERIIRQTPLMSVSKKIIIAVWLQTTQPTRGGAITVVWQNLCKLCRPLPCNRNDSTCITVTAATTLTTYGTTTTSQTDQGLPQDYKHHTSTHTPHKHTYPAVKVTEISSYCLFTTHMQISSQFRKPSSPLKPKHP